MTEKALGKEGRGGQGRNEERSKYERGAAESAQDGFPQSSCGP